MTNGSILQSSWILNTFLLVLLGSLYHLNKLQEASDERNTFKHRRSLTRQTISNESEDGACCQKCAGKNDTLCEEG